MTNGNGNDRLDRIEKILEETAARQHEMAARQQYHDEAFGRQDTATRDLRAAIEIDAENIRALARIAEAPERRPDDIDGR
jgi:hypothetical protein